MRFAIRGPNPGPSLPMRILSLEDLAFHALSYRSVATATGIASLPFHRGRVDHLPEGIEALVLTSDLQGRDADADRLLGERVAEELGMLGARGDLPPPARLGVILGGDLHCEKDAMGGIGDVRAVWRAFAASCAWVVGVPGNHDAFGRQAEAEGFWCGANWRVLDGGCAGVGESVQLGGCRIAGVGGIVGRETKPNRRREEAFVAAVQQQLAARPDLLVTHQHPDVPGLRRPGSKGYRHLLDENEALIVFGHTPVPVPLLRLGRSVALGTDHRVIVLTRCST